MFSTKNYLFLSVHILGIIKIKFLIINIYIYIPKGLIYYFKLCVLCYRKNISYSAMCGTIGQVIGIFLGFVFLMVLMSETFWNKWRSSPQPDGIVSLQGRYRTLLE